MRYYSSVAQATTLTEAATAGATVIKVAGTGGFPTSYPFTLVLSPDTPEEEIVTVTGADGLTLAVVRGEDGTTAVDHTAGDQVRHMITARDLREAQEHINATSNIHGASGTLVTTSATQTLTNKTLDGSQNTFANIPAAAIQGEVVAGSGGMPAGSITAFAGASAPSGWLLCNGAAISRATYSALFNVIGTTYGAGDGSSTFNVPNLKGRIPVGLDSGETEFNALNKVGGEKMHTLTTAEMPYHDHGMNHTHSMGHTHSMSHSHNVSIGSSSHSHDGTTNSSYAGESSFVTQINHADNRASGSLNNYNSYSTRSTSHSHSFTTNSHSHSHSASIGTYSGSTGGSDTATTSGASSTSTGSTGSGAAHNNLQPYITLNYIIKT